ncbi:MAG: hypothetical protein AAGJ28_23395 [Pseudomonadota bacterium]
MGIFDFTASKDKKTQKCAESLAKERLAERFARRVFYVPDVENGARQALTDLQIVQKWDSIECRSECELLAQLNSAAANDIGVLDVGAKAVDAISTLTHLSEMGCAANIILTTKAEATTALAVRYTAQELGLHISDILMKPVCAEHLRKTLNAL